jgi:PST family polysaccharide transporter
MSHPRVFGRALRWSFVLSWGQRGLATIFTVALAAILGPRDFGILAMAIVYVQLIEGLLEQGIGTAIIQRKNLRREHLDSAFWLNLGWGLALAGVGVATSGLWASAMRTPDLKPVVIALSAMTILRALSIVQEAYLQRSMEFKKLALRANIAALVGGTVGIGLAVTGAGVWALVGQQLATEVVALVVIWLLSPYVPRFRLSRRPARELLGFSIDVFFANLAGFLGRRGDVLLMGAFFGPVVVGVYRLADRFADVLLELTMRPVGAVSLPQFSRLQDDPAKLKEAVGACIRVAGMAAVPALLLLAACSEPLLRVIGEEWVIGATALKLLALAGIARALVFFTGPLLFALARARFRAIMLWSLALATSATVVAAGLALRGDSDDAQLLGMSASRLAVLLAIAVPLNFVIIRVMSGLTVREIMPWLRVPFAAGAVAVGLVAAIEAAGVVDALPPIPGLIVSLAAAISGVAATMLILEPRARAGLHEIFGRLRAGQAVRPSATTGPDPIERS